MYADSHCHLDDRQFAGDREEVIARARAEGLRYMLAIGTGDGPPDLECALRLADRYEEIYATAGIHPNDAAKIQANSEDKLFRNLEQLLRHPKVKAVGEIGLDYHWGIPKEVQVPIFVSQLAIARAAHMPVVIHTRDSWGDTIDVLRTHWDTAIAPCIMHCFTGDAAQARECVNLGFYLAFGGVATFPKALSVREAARETPADRLLLETDAPYLAPVPHRGKRNEPAYVLHTARAIAELRGMFLGELAAQTTSNFLRAFSIDTKDSAGFEQQLN